MSDTEPSVLIVGAGLTGLAGAVYLAWHGVPVEVVEARSGTLIHPRARTVNPRTVEVLRQVGLEEAVIGARSFTREMPSVQRVRADTLAGPEVYRIEHTPPQADADAREISCCRWGSIDQDVLEGLLAARARELGVVIRFDTRLLALDQDGDGVTAEFQDRDGARVVRRAEYVIGADGTHSAVRRLLGVERRGPGILSNQLSMVFQADLSEALRGRHDPDNNRYIAVAHLNKPTEGTVLSPYGTDKWVFHTPYDPGRDGSADQFDDERCAGFIRAAIGLDDLAPVLVPQLADGTKVLGYEVAGLVADRFRSGRVFLAGDSAHVMPPAGAFGGGTCIQDAHNLAWKLAAVLTGEAGPALLDTYEAERRPVALFTLGQAMGQLRVVAGVDHGAAAAAEPVEYYTVVFGYRYSSDAVISEDGQTGETVATGDLSGQPGTRAPHVPLDLAAAESTLDLYGTQLVLLAGGRGEAWCEAAQELSAESRIRLRTYGSALPATVASAYGISEEGAVLVRPDGFVAWRSVGASADPRAELSAVLERVLCRAADRDPQLVS